MSLIKPRQLSLHMNRKPALFSDGPRLKLKDFVDLMDSGNKQRYEMIMDGDVVFVDDGVLVIEGIYEIIRRKENLAYSE